MLSALYFRHFCGAFYLLLARLEMFLMTFTFREENALFGSIIIAMSSCRARSLHVPPSFVSPSKLRPVCAVMNVKRSQKPNQSENPDDFTFNAWVARRKEIGVMRPALVPLGISVYHLHGEK